MEAATAALSAQDVTTLNKILAAVEEEINICDPKHNLGLSHFNDILSGVLEKVYAHMGSEQRSELNEGDLALIQQLVRRQVTEQLASVLLPKLRFEISDRVVCLIGGDRPWAAGKVQALHEPDPSDPTGQVRFPYVVKIDPPNGRLVSVPRDSHDVVRPEVCFGQRAGALFFTRMCRPVQARRRPKLRFREGERVACAVEDATSNYTAWAAGTVTAVDLPLLEEGEADTRTDGTCAAGDAPEAPGGRCCGELRGPPPARVLVPYQVRLDTGCEVLVHRDEHWLVRDLTLQREGVRIGADGTRCLGKFSRRQADGGWEVADQETRKVRRLQPGEESDEDDED